jgi:hypothetical protein
MTGAAGRPLFRPQRCDRIAFLICQFAVVENETRARVFNNMWPKPIAAESAIIPSSKAALAIYVCGVEAPLFVNQAHTNEKAEM